jgi:hypothetical protein
MKREIIRVEPLSTYLERWKAATSVVTRHGDTIYVSGFPPSNPNSSQIVVAPIARRTENWRDGKSLVRWRAHARRREVQQKGVDEILGRLSSARRPDHGGPSYSSATRSTNSVSTKPKLERARRSRSLTLRAHSSLRRQTTRSCQ